MATDPTASTSARIVLATCRHRVPSGIAPSPPSQDILCGQRRGPGRASLPSPAPEYNFATIPQVAGLDAWWATKYGPEGEPIAQPERPQVRAEDIHSVHMPTKTAYPFLLGASFFVMGFGVVFKWWPIAFVGLAGIAANLLFAWFDYDEHESLPAEHIRSTETSFGRVSM